MMGCDAEYGMHRLMQEAKEKDARIAQLTAREAELVAEVAKYREALSSVTDFSNDPAVHRIVRHALGEN